MNGTRKDAAADPSGRFLLRIDPSLHRRLREAAKDAGISLNDLCSVRLSAPVTDVGGPGAAVAARAASQFGDALVAVILYGSWARDELASDSDIDVLVVVDDEVSITRTLYREWDEQPLTWESREVDVHFAHQPAGERAGGLWFEVAIEGLVLFDRDLRLSRTLAAIRSLVASGRIVRHHSSGHSYWVEMP